MRNFHRIAIAALILAAAAAVVCGCAGKTKAARITETLRDADSYSVTVRAVIKEKQFDYLVTKSGERVRVEVLSPPALKDFAVTLSSDRYSVEYLGLSFVTGTLPDELSRAMGPVFTFMEAMKSAPDRTQRRGGTVTVSYDLDGRELTAVFDVKTGLPVSFVYDGDTTLEFLEFTF